MIATSLDLFNNFPISAASVSPNLLQKFKSNNTFFLLRHLKDFPVMPINDSVVIPPPLQLAVVFLLS